MLDMGDDSNAHRSYIARQLWIVAGEDLYDQGIVLQAFAVFQMVHVARETDHLYQLVHRMATEAGKLHSTPGGVEMDDLWGKAQGEIRRGWWRKVPSYAVDQHTYRGKVLIKRGVYVDQRFNGTDFGRVSTRYLFDRDGVSFGPGSEWDGRFWQVWRQVKDRFGVGLRRPLRRKGDEPAPEVPQMLLIDPETGEIVSGDD